MNREQARAIAQKDLDDSNDGVIRGITRIEEADGGWLVYYQTQEFIDDPTTLEVIRKFSNSVPPGRAAHCCDAAER